jgi:hypothetical protein
MGFLADPLSITMCLFVTGVGTLIHLYAIGYMHGDEQVLQVLRLPQPVRLLDADAGAGDNLLVTFLGWEGVGACSYFLISFWYRAKSTPRRARRPSSPTGSATSASSSAPCWCSPRSAPQLPRLAGIVRPAPTGHRTTAIAIALLFFVARGQVGPASAVRLAARRHGRTRPRSRR